LRDPAGVPFYPVVFQGLYVLTWALHATFVFLALGSMALSLVAAKSPHDPNWKLLRTHMIQTGKISVSLLIVLGVAPLLFTQVIYDPNWYVTNTLSGVWVFTFIYTLIVGYSMYYWYYYANKNESKGNTLIGIVSFALLVFAGVIMHVLAYESIQPTKWMQWYAPGGIVDTSGLNFHYELIRLLFMFSLGAPAVGAFLMNYSDFISTRGDFSSDYIAFSKNLGRKIASVGLIVSALLFIGWMLQIGMLFNPLSIVTVIAALAFLAMLRREGNSYMTTGVLFVVVLLVSGVREYIKYNLMNHLGYNIYTYHMNIDWPSVIMFLTTFLSFGFIGVSFIATMAWKVGKTQGIFDASKDAAVTRLANGTLSILGLWVAVYLLWGIFTVFKDTLH
jgi:hypothetical protein